MPAPTTVSEFVDLVRKSGLLTDPTLDELIERHRNNGTLPQAIDPFAAVLVRESQLTYFQAKQIKLGRYKRFTIGSKYRLLELIGAGGMGAVYLCEHTLMKRLVALKVLPVEKLDDPSCLERFHREARAVAALDHPNIVRAYDIDVHEKLHFLVMEYVDGNSLQDLIARHGPMDAIRAAHYIAQSAVGLQHAHELGMVHRDIKPGNLLLERTGVIKILDMGLARFFHKSQDCVTEKYDDKCVLGTADYLAPEQAVSSNVDIRADIYSLGGTFYYMLTGKTPFPDGTIAAKLMAHQNIDRQPPKAIDEFRGDVPRGILEVLRRMMAKEPEDRFQEPIEVAEALAEWADLPIDAPPAKEMPGHCPLVLSLTGHSVDRMNGSSMSVPLGKAIFGPGRSTMRMSGSSTRSALRPVVVAAASVETERVNDSRGSSAMRTTTDGPSSHGNRKKTSSPPVKPHPRRIRIALAVALGGLLAAGMAVGAYYIGKMENAASANK